jgi:hypothetical protein
MSNVDDLTILQATALHALMTNGFESDVMKAAAETIHEEDVTARQMALYKIIARESWIMAKVAMEARMEAK